MDKNRIEGAAEQGERAWNREPIRSNPSTQGLSFHTTFRRTIIFGYVRQ
jgi:hypothetical protein